MLFPRLMITAPASGSGKSVIASGLMAAFSKRYPVQGFKVGPDYIDPMYHTIATGRPSRNLDTWMLLPETVQQIFLRAAKGASLSVIEGVMGLFDGHGSDPFVGSSADIVSLLLCPVILVLDCSKMSGSAAAIVHGMDTFSNSLHLSGVICNRVGSEGHGRWLKEAIEKYTSIPVLGCIPNLPALMIPERHLGLFTVAENPSTAKEFIDQASAILAQYLDLERIESIAKAAVPLLLPEDKTSETQIAEPRVRLAVARDEAFCFYYEDNLEALRQNGAEIVPFSPLEDEQLPAEISGIYFGGGYPELYAEQLSQNTALCGQIRSVCQQQMPVYAECGGLMYLTQGISRDQEKQSLAGVLPGWCKMSERLTMGYREVKALRSNLLTAPGLALRGHEFHYSSWQVDCSQRAAYQVFPRRQNENLRLEGFARDNILASYIHLHFAQNTQLAKRFIEHCRSWQVEHSQDRSFDQC